MHAGRCPKCGHDMRVVWGQERTVRGGIWFTVACPTCLHVGWVFRPRRSTKK